jgi:hypothetical protein
MATPARAATTPALATGGDRLGISLGASIDTSSRSLASSSTANDGRDHHVAASDDRRVRVEVGDVGSTVRTTLTRSPGASPRRWVGARVEREADDAVARPGPWQVGDRPRS